MLGTIFLSSARVMMVMSHSQCTYTYYVLLLVGKNLYESEHYANALHPELQRDFLCVEMVYYKIQ